MFALAQYDFVMASGEMVPVFAVDLLAALAWAEGIPWVYISERYGE